MVEPVFFFTFSTAIGCHGAAGTFEHSTKLASLSITNSATVHCSMAHVTVEWIKGKDKEKGESTGTNGQ